jgi:Tfp pilus assembly protein PilO
MNNDKVLVKNKYFPTLPYLTQERSQKFFSIVLTLCALSLFGFFAIKPTISTILRLKKEISDNQFVFNQMETKIKNLTELRKQYFSLQGDLPMIMNTITAQPDVPILFAQIQSIAQASNISIGKLQNFEVEVLRNDKSADKNYYSYSFSVAGAGSFEDISKFILKLTDMERVVNIDMFSINNISDKNQESLGFDIQGVAFFKDSL